MPPRDPRDDRPEVRAGLSSRARIVLKCLHARHKARGGRPVPTRRLYESVVEASDMRAKERQRMLVRRDGHPRRPA
jgi:hypothetical protein